MRVLVSPRWTICDDPIPQQREPEVRDPRHLGVLVKIKVEVVTLNVDVRVRVADKHLDDGCLLGEGGILGGTRP